MESVMIGKVECVFHSNSNTTLNNFIEAVNQAVFNQELESQKLKRKDFKDDSKNQNRKF